MPSLDALLHSEIEVAAVVTNPDRPAGRGMQLRPSPVKQRALEAGVEVIQPEKVREPWFHDRLRALAPDLAVVVAYGSILPVSLLVIPPHGFVNVHFSLLPLYRGAAPVQRTILDGRDRTGVSLMVLTQGMDEGPVLARRDTDIGPEDTAGAVGERLSRIGAELLVTVAPDYVSGKVAPEPQDDSLATYAPKITPEEGRIDWSRPAASIDAQVRAMDPVPGAWTTLDGERLKVWRVKATHGVDLAPRELMASERLVVGTADDALELLDVQLRGKRRMSGFDLARGLRVGPKHHLGS